MVTARIFMIAGLGNPEKKYFQTRHNIGFMVVDRLAQQNALKFGKPRFDSEYVSTVYKQDKLFLVKPQSYMNKSGFPIQKLASYFKINISNIIVVHDDIDLPFGRLRISKSRGHGGHNGIRSIIEALGTKDFIRIRIGIANPERQNSVTGHVLGDFSKEETKFIAELIEKAADASMSVIKDGALAAMNSYNSI
ncbi:MAG: aminoacyl-tRNA hydrolase [Desulfobacteraceae bacterium]|nr:aminoacyl-tRNA hydrolase [Desulfobacteraceae bacterium]